jgi:hypothetical protein
MAPAQGADDRARTAIGAIEIVVACEFRFNPATDSDVKPAGVPI